MTRAGKSFSVAVALWATCRLAWMHRLLKEQLAEPGAETSAPAVRFQALFAGDPQRPLPGEVSSAALERLRSLVNLRPGQGWVHGDIQSLALLHDGDQQLRTATDWGLLHYGCPLEDLVDAFLFLATTPGKAGIVDASRAGVLMEAYDSLVPIRNKANTAAARVSYDGDSLRTAARPLTDSSPLSTSISTARSRTAGRGSPSHGSSSRPA